MMNSTDGRGSNNSILMSAAEEASLSFCDVDYDYEYDYGDFETNNDIYVGGSGSGSYDDSDQYGDNEVNMSNPLFDNDQSFERRFNQSVSRCSDEEENNDESFSDGDGSYGGGEGGRLAALRRRRIRNQHHQQPRYKNDSLRLQNQRLGHSGPATTLQKERQNNRKIGSVNHHHHHLSKPTIPGPPPANQRVHHQGIPPMGFRGKVSVVSNETFTKPVDTKPGNKLSKMNARTTHGHRHRCRSRHDPPSSSPENGTIVEQQGQPSAPESSLASDCFFPTACGDNKERELECCGGIFLEDVVVKQQRRRRKPDAPATGEDDDDEEEASSTCGSQASQTQQQLLCVHVCPKIECDVSTCRPSDLDKAATTDLQRTIKDPSFFYVPVALVLKREREMQLAAKRDRIPKNRWNGSLLYRRWQDIEEKEEEEFKEKERQPTTKRKKEAHCRGRRRPKIITLHPVQAMAHAHVVSDKFPWWQSWLTICIRAYYNTGTLRIPNECHGLEILLALEFFGILYASPDQLVFDAPEVYNKVKQWSSYFSLRSVMAQYVVDQLLKRRQQQEQQKPSLFYQQPFIFCTHPEILKPGWFLCFETKHQQQPQPIAILEGGLYKGNNNNLSASSSQVVHDFFVPCHQLLQSDIDDPIYSSPAVVPGMMREDFVSYLRHVIPNVDITFKLQQVQLVPPKMHKRKLPKLSLRRAVLVITYTNSSGRHPPMNKKQYHPAPQREVPKTMPLQEKSTAISNNNKIGNTTTNSILDLTQMPSFVPEEEQLSVISAASSAFGSISAAPTDEMAFGRLLNDGHKLVKRLLQQSTEEKATGSGKHNNEDFYFHRDNENQVEQPAATTTTTKIPYVREDSKAAKGEGKGRARQTDKIHHMAAPFQSPLYQVEIQMEGLPRTTSERGIRRAEPKSDVAPRKTPDCDHRPTTNRFGYAVPTDPVDYEALGAPIYEDLYQESMFPNSDAMATGLPRVCTADSPLWTPSLVREESPPAPVKNNMLEGIAPISFVNAPSQLSVTSSITRQPESVEGASSWRVNLLRPQQQTETPNRANIKSVENKENGGSGRQSAKISCGAVDNPFVKEAPAGGVEDPLTARKLHDESFEARFDALLNNTGEGIGKSKQGARKEKQAEPPLKQRIRAALEDLQFGINQDDIKADLDEIRRAATETPGDQIPCQSILSDMYEIFTGTQRPSVVVANVSVGHDGIANPSRRSTGSKDSSTTSTATDSTSVYTSQETRASHPNFSRGKKIADAMGGAMGDAMGINEEDIQTAALLLQVLASASSSASVTGNDAEKENQMSAPTPEESAEARARKLVIPKSHQTTEDDPAANNGIEVYHIPVTSPPAPTPGASNASGSSSPKPPRSTTMLRGKLPVSPKRRVSRGVKPPLSPTVQPKRESQAHQNAKRIAPHKKCEKKGRRLFGFMRSKLQK